MEPKPTLLAHQSVHATRFALRSAAGCSVTVHPEAVLLTLIEGRASMWAASTYELSSGDLLLIPEGTPHYLISSEGAEALGVSLCAPCLRLAGGRLDMLSSAFRAVMRGASAQQRLSPGGHRQVVGAIESLAYELSTQDPGYQLVVEANLVQIGVAIHRARSATPVSQGAGVDSLSSRALAFISKNALEGISLADVARHVSRSRSHTSDTIRRETGRTVSDWIIGSRLAVSQQLMLDTDETIDMIASRSGFASRSHFHRAFKRFYGLPPGEWRRVHAGRSPMNAHRTSTNR